MPFPNEHAARQVDPGQFESFRRTKPKGFPKGVSAIMGIRSNGKTAIQSLRFDKNLWTVAQARTWLRNNKFKTTIEPASGKPVNKNFWGNAV